MGGVGSDASCDYAAKVEDLILCKARSTMIPRPYFVSRHQIRATSVVEGKDVSRFAHALAGLDVLSRHLAYPAIATAAGRSRVITGYFGLTISSAKLVFNVSLYTAVCCLCILSYLKLSSFSFNARQQVVLQPVDAEAPNAAQVKSGAIVAQVVAVVDLPFMVFNGCLTDPLKTISLVSLAFATLVSLLSFVFPTLWQHFFWSTAIFAVYVVASIVTLAVSPPSAEPTRDLEV